MATDTEAEPSRESWSEMAKAILRGELKRQRMTYADLVEGLAGLGIRETEANLRNKISRGNFSAAFFLQCLHTIGVDILVLSQANLSTRRSFPSARARIAAQSLMDTGRSRDPVDED